MPVSHTIFLYEPPSSFALPPFFTVTVPVQTVSASVTAKLPFPIPDPVSNYERRQYPNLRVYINAEVIPDIVRVLHGCGKAAYFSHHFLWDIGHYFQSKMMMMGRYVELFMDYATQLECARSLTEKDFAIICSVGGSYLTRYPDICNAILSSGCKMLIITQNLASPYLNTADFILQCGTTNRNDVGKYAALMANDLILMGYLRAYDKAFQ